MSSVADATVEPVTHRLVTVRESLMPHDAGAERRNYAGRFNLHPRPRPDGCQWPRRSDENGARRRPLKPRPEAWMQAPGRLGSRLNPVPKRFLGRACQLAQRVPSQD
jgi:hypothetical protein